MVKENLLLKMGPFSKDNLKMAQNVAWEFTNGVIIHYIMDNGKTISLMAKENIIGVMAGTTLEHGE